MSHPRDDFSQAGLPPKLRQLIDSVRNATPVNGVAAAKTLTFSGNGVDGNLVTINGVIFELDTGGAITSGHVTVDISGGAGLTASAAALATAIRATPSCLVTAVETGGAVACTALTRGVAGNAYTLAETATNGAWAGGATLMSGGIDSTVGTAWDVCADASYVYVNTADSDVTSANWGRAALSVGY